MRTRTLAVCSLLAVLALACGEATLSRGPGLAEGPAPTQLAPAPEAPPAGEAPAPAPPAPPAPAPAPEAPPPEPVQLVIEAPARGARIDTPRVSVIGRVTGGVAPRLTVGGQPVVPGPDGTFSTDLPAPAGLTRVITEVEDETGSLQDVRAVLRGADADPARPVDDAIRATVGPEGLAALGQVVAAYVEGLDLTTLIGDTGDFEVRSLTYEGVEVHLTPQDGSLGVRLVVKELRVEAAADVRLVFRVSIRGSARARRAVIDTRLRLAPTAEGGLDLSLDGGEVNLEGFSFDVRNVPDFAERWFYDTARGFAEGFVEDALSSFVIPALFDPSALDQSLDILGTSIDLGLRVQTAGVTPAGLALGLSGRAEAPQVVRAGGALPTAPGDGRHGGAHADVAARDGFVGRLLHAAWAGGVLDLVVGPGGAVELPAGIGLNLFRNALGDSIEGVPRDAEFSMRTRPLLPPVVRVVPGGGAPLVVEIGDLLLDLEVAGAVRATVSMHLTVEVSLRVATTPAGIELEPELTVQVWTDTAEAPLGPVDEGALEQRVATFANLLPGLIAGQTFSVGADLLPIPVGLDQARVEADDPAWLHVRADLVAP